MNLVRIKELILRGEKLNYKGQPAKILSCENKFGAFSIEVELNGETVVFKKLTEKAIDQWLDNFSKSNGSDEIQQPELINSKLPARNNPHGPVAIYLENKEALVNLSKMLLEDIEKVRQDPKYVPQAKQVCNSINAIVNITKLQVQLLGK